MTTHVTTKPCPVCSKEAMASWVSYETWFARCHDTDCGACRERMRPCPHPQGFVRGKCWFCDGSEPLSPPELHMTSRHEDPST